MQERKNRNFWFYGTVFGVGQSNGVVYMYIYPRPTPVAMATKFGTKKRNLEKIGVNRSYNSVSILYIYRRFFHSIARLLFSGKFGNKKVTFKSQNVPKT